MLDKIPTAYSTPGWLGVKPGADWFVNGRRYRESARTQLENGYRATLTPVDADSALGYNALRTEES